jgi:hypothetical protein
MQSIPLRNNPSHRKGVGMIYSPDKNLTLTTDFTPEPSDAGVKRYWNQVRSLQTQKTKQAIEKNLK